MAKKIVKVEDEPKTKKKANIDLSKIGQVISENRGTIEMVAGALLGSAAKKTATKKSGTTKKTTKSSSKTKASTGLDAMDIIGSLLKK